MQRFSSLLSGRTLRLSAVLIAVLALTGCQTLMITNMTPDNLPANPSQIYTITASFEPGSRTIDPATIQPRIIIDGQSYPMSRNRAADNLWEFEYQLPPGRTSAAYYFIVSFGYKDTAPGASTQNMTSELHRLHVAGRYVIRAEANRAPVGARVSVLGAGFNPADVVYFDLTPTRTVFESPSSLSFFVPAVPTGQSYQLRVSGGGETLPVGSFRVDALEFTVFPTLLHLRSGEHQALTFTLPQPAPAGGMLIDVTTDVPQSVIMPEVIVPAGQTSVTVPVQGGRPGSGSLYFKSSAGVGSVSITVR
jgi:hypothetical protein